MQVSPKQIGWLYPIFRRPSLLPRAAKSNYILNSWWREGQREEPRTSVRNARIASLRQRSLAEPPTAGGLHEKYKAEQAYNPETFVDPEGYRAAVERHEKLYREQLAAERR